MRGVHEQSRRLFVRDESFYSFRTMCDMVNARMWSFRLGSPGPQPLPHVPAFILQKTPICWCLMQTIRRTGPEIRIWTDVANWRWARQKLVASATPSPASYTRVSAFVATRQRDIAFTVSRNRDLGYGNWPASFMSRGVEALVSQHRLLVSKRHPSPAPPSKMSFPILASEAL